MGIEKFDEAPVAPGTTLSGVVDLSDRKSNAVLASMRENQIATAEPLTLVDASDDPATIRARLVDSAAKAMIAEGGLYQNGESGAFVGGVIQHQYAYNGGASAADSVAQDINAKLPKGWTLKITNDPAFRAMVENEFKRTGKSMPAYIRKVELFDGDKSLGAIGVTIQGQPTTKIKGERGHTRTSTEA